MDYYLPYKIDIGSDEEFYNSLEMFSGETLNQGKKILDNIINLRLNTANASDHEVKSILLELLIIGVLWKNHISDATSTSKSSLAELEYFKTFASSDDEMLKKIYLKMRADILVHHPQNIDARIGISLQSFLKLIDWLEATGEYNYELPVLKNWYNILRPMDNIQAKSYLHQIAYFTYYFNRLGENMLGSYLNPVFFKVMRKSINADREDYFQVSKSELEYYLNFLAVIWLNDINDKHFQMHTQRKIMAPGCMRPNNGTNCKATIDGSYLKCAHCDTNCNIYKLQKEAVQLEYEVRIALHQSTFKAETQQLRDTGIIGVACAGCLVSGGFMLLQEGIYAKCLILNKPGCNKHWSVTGEATSISLSQLRKVTVCQAPVVCKVSDS